MGAETAEVLDGSKFRTDRTESTHLAAHHGDSLATSTAKIGHQRHEHKNSLQVIELRAHVEEDGPDGLDVPDRLDDSAPTTEWVTYPLATLTALSPLKLEAVSKSSS